jgi:hypothetical protein
MELVMALPTTPLTREGTAGNDDLWGFDSQATTLIGYEGNDTFRATSPAGIVVQFNSLYAENTLDFTGWFRETDLLDSPLDGPPLDDVNTLNLVVTGPEGVDSVHRYYRYDRAMSWGDGGVGSLTFKDGTLRLKEAGHVLDTPQFIPEASATDSLRYYLATFGRLPDADGLSWWIDQREAGMTAEKQADLFLGSAEFQASAGLSNHDFLTHLYQGAFSRAADAGGMAFWEMQLAGGAGREAVVDFFATSDEMTARVAHLAADGIDLI